MASRGTFEQHLAIVERVIQALDDAKLKLKPQKISLCQPFTEFLGNIYSNQTMKMPDTRVQGFLDLMPPKTVKQCKGIIAAISFYRRYIDHFAQLTQPMHELTLLKEGQKFKWTAEADQAFVALKKAISAAVALHIPRSDRPYTCFSDASDKALGFAIEQRDEEQNRLPIGFFSKMFTKAEQNHSIFRKESSAIVYGLVSNAFFFDGCLEIHIMSDARALSFLGVCKAHNTALARVAITLSSYALKVSHLRGEDNLVADSALQK